MKARAGIAKKHHRVKTRGRLVRRNPAAAPAELERAKRLFRDFRGAEPFEVLRRNVTMPRAVLTVGECIGIMYRTERDGKVENYLHRFSRKARPILVSSPDGRALYLLGGAYRVTSRGIVDSA